MSLFRYPPPHSPIPLAYGAWNALVMEAVAVAIVLGLILVGGVL